MVRKLLTTFIISFILIAISLLSYAALHSVALLCFFLVMILIFILYSSYSILLKKTDYVQQLEKYTRYSFFKADIEMIIRSYKSIEKREEYVAGLDNDSIVDIYNQVKAQVINNINSAYAFCQSYDYVIKGSTEYLHELARECQELVAKLNILFEELIDVETSVFDVDTRKIDDLIEALRTIKNNK